MRSMSKLAVLVGASAPLMLLASSALADPPTSPPANVVVAPAAPPAAPAAVVAVPAPAAGTAVVVAEPASPIVDGKVEVHIQTKELVTLEHRTGPGAPWQTACETPCDVRLPAGDQYRVVGEGINESEPFALTSPTGDVVKIHVAPGLKKRAKTGELLTFTGVVLVVGAVVVGLAAAEPGSVFQANGSTNNYNWDVIAVGTGIAIAGVATGLFGASWWYDNSHTRVAGDVQADQPAHGGLEPRYQTGMRMSSPTIPTYTTTLFSTSF